MNEKLCEEEFLLPNKEEGASGNKNADPEQGDEGSANAEREDPGDCPHCSNYLGDNCHSNWTIMGCECEDHSSYGHSPSLHSVNSQ